jgi:hypothetical protein
MGGRCAVGALTWPDRRDPDSNQNLTKEKARMATSIFDDEVQSVLDNAQTPIGTLFPSPEDWRDQPIYFLLVDRFNNPDAAIKMAAAELIQCLINQREASGSLKLTER